MDKNGKLAVNIPWTNTTYNAATTFAAGLMSAADKTKLDSIAAGANNYSLPLASSWTRGGVKIGYTQSGKNYPVQLSSEKMYVNVPWTDTTYTFTNKNATLAWGTKSTIATVGGTDITVTMPANPNTNTHYSAYLYATSSSGTAHAATTNGNTYLRLIENYTARSSIKVAGAGLTTVSSDGSGNITISTLNGTNAGDANTPIYLNGGTFTACTSLDLNTTGNAATATKATQDGDGAVISSTYLPLSGGTMTGAIITPGNDSVVIRPAKNNYDQIGSSSYKFWQIYATTFYGALSGNASTATKLQTARTISLTGDVTGSGTFDGSSNLSITATVANNNHNHDNYLPKNPVSIEMFPGSSAGHGGFIDFHYNSSSADYTSRIIESGSGTLDINGANITGGKVYGAVWNDYAEYRSQKEEIKPGYCVASTDNGQVYKTTEKFQACDGIVSDTFGFAIGETDECTTPLAVAGRVLAYFHGNREDYNAGDTVCAGPEGKIMKMTREEIKEYPDRIIGIVSEIPEYKTWGSGNVEVNNRIWIKVK